MTIRQARVLAEKTQAEVAQELGVHVNTYAIWEKNPIDCKLKHLLRIAHILNVDINDLDILRREYVCTD